MTEAERSGAHAAPAESPDLHITAVSSDGAAVVRLDGELDLSTAPRAERALADELGPGARTVVVDLRGLEFCDAAGLRVFVSARSRAQESGARLRLVHPSRMVRRILDVAELGWLLSDGGRATECAPAGSLARA